MTLAELGETIRLRRKELHMTQRQLAEKADIDYQTVSTLENGYKGPRWDTLMMVLEALGMKMEIVEVEHAEEKVTGGKAGDCCSFGIKVVG